MPKEEKTMYDLEKIKNLTSEEVQIVSAMKVIAEQAQEIVDLIRGAYSFRMGEEKIQVMNDGPNSEFLTHSGVWQARYLHQTYDVSIDKESIFDLQLASYLIEKGFAESSIDAHMTPEGEKQMIDRYFMSFVQRTKTKLENEELKKGLEEEFE